MNKRIAEVILHKGKQRKVIAGAKIPCANLTQKIAAIIREVELAYPGYWCSVRLVCK